MKLVIFDLDGTLVDRDTEQPLPGRLNWFEAHWDDNCRWAIATNQGGVGLRYWMETAKFGDPSKYPTQQAAIEHVIHSLQPFKDNGIHFDIAISYAYLSKKGEWSPTPPNQEGNKRWSKGWRKPNPGMLEYLMLLRTDNSDFLFVGDSPEDEQAAVNAGIPFVQAEEFFRK